MTESTTPTDADTIVIGEAEGTQQPQMDIVAQARLVEDYSSVIGYATRRDG